MSSRPRRPSHRRKRCSMRRARRFKIGKTCSFSSPSVRSRMRVFMPRAIRRSAHRSKRSRFLVSEALVLSPEPQPAPRKRGRARKESLIGESSEGLEERLLGDANELDAMNQVTSAAE
jgi:hypothetical protein